jgi:hypothetical protein
MSRRRSIFSTLLLCGLVSAIVLWLSWDRLRLRHHIALLKAADQDLVALHQGKRRMTLGRLWEAILGRTGSESGRAVDSYQQEQKALLQLGWLFKQEFAVNWTNGVGRFYSNALHRLPNSCCWSFMPATSGNIIVIAPTNTLPEWKKLVSDFNSKSMEGQ